MASAKARAQAHEALEDAAKTLKRTQAAIRVTLQTVRQAQAVLTGIDVDINPIAREGTGHGITDEDQGS